MGSQRLAKALAEYDLGDAGLQLFRDRLNAPSTALIKALGTLPLVQGRFVTYLPAKTPLPMLRSFLASPPSGTHQAAIAKLAELVTTFLKKYEDSCFLLPDDMSRRGDAWISTRNPQVCYAGTGVYHFLWGQGAEQVKVETMLSLGYSHFMTGVLTQAQGVQLQQDKDIAEEDLVLLASNCSVIVLSAYDNEAYVYWFRE